MPNPILGSAVYLLPGMKIKLNIPLNIRNMGGYFVSTVIPQGFFSDFNNASTVLLRGFGIEDTTVGTLETDPTSPVDVVYTHKKLYENSIWFFAATGEIGVTKVISVPIHDHSSIVQGGPAYGTYFDDASE